MFERYTEKTRRVIFLARFFACESGSGSIEPEHILLAIMREEPDLFRPWLKSEDDYQTLRTKIQAPEQGKEKIPESANMSFSGPSKQVLGYAAEEAERQNNTHVLPSHFLAALLRMPDTVAARALAAMGVRIQEVRMVFVASLKQPATQRPETEELHRLIDQLPGSKLEQAREMLEALRESCEKPTA